MSPSASMSSYLWPLLVACCQLPKSLPVSGSPEAGVRAYAALSLHQRPSDVRVSGVLGDVTVGVHVLVLVAALGGLLPVAEVVAGVWHTRGRGEGVRRSLTPSAPFRCAGERCPR